MENNKIKVLLIEDNPGDARLIREYLDEAKEAAFHVEHVDCLSKGLSWIARWGIDAILLDLSLPDSQGLDSLSKILAQTQAVPIVVLSGLKDEAVAIQAVQQGAQDYLVKGNIDSSLLVRSLRYAIERQRLRVALRESENSYRLLADNIADVIWTADLKGRINYVSPSIKNFLGYTVGETVKLEMKDILTPDSAEQAKRLIRDQIALWNPWVQHAPLSLTLEHIRQDGSTLWSDVRLSFLCNEKGHITGILGVTRDITDRKKAEEAISESETQYRSLVETASKAGLGITIVQNTKDEEAVFVFVNDEYCKISGYSREELLGRSSFDTIPPENLASIRERYGRRQKGETPPSYYESTVLRKDGTRVPIETSVSVFIHRGKPATVSFFKDITERKRAEEALRKSEERYRLLADNAVDVIWTMDMKGRINYVSPSAQRLFGYSVDEIMALQIRELLTPASAEIARKVVIEEMRMKTAVSQNSYCSLFLEHVHKDGSTFWTEVVLSFLRDEHGRITLIQGVTRDITERRKAEEALRESEQRYRLLAENVKDIIWTRDMNLKLTYTSPSVYEMSGYTVEEVMSMSLEESMTPASLKRLRPTLAKVLGANEKGQVDLPETVVLELDLLHRNGSVVPVEMKVNMLHDSEGRPLGFLGVTRDITERKKAEEALRESEERFRRLVDHAPDIIFRWSVRKGLEYVSPIVTAITGYTPEELMSAPLIGLKLAKYGDRQLVEIYERVLAKGVVEPVRELSFMRKDGEKGYIDVRTQAVRDDKGEIVAFEGIVRDITDKKLAEEALWQSEQSYKVLLESTHDSIIVVDAETSKVIFGNRRAALMFGFDPVLHDGVGVNLLDFIHPEDREIAIKGFVEDLYQQERRQRYDVRANTKDGREIWISALGTRIEFKGRVAVLLSLRDVTKDKQIEEEKRRLEEQIQLAGRLAAVGELAAGVAHELNNPIAAIQGFAQLLKGRKDLDTTMNRDLETIYKESQRAAKITQNLLTFARKHEPETSFISLNEALQKTLELHVHQMKVNNIELVVELAPDLPKTMADFYQMQQVFMNIINNAEQAMVEAHGKGRFLVQTRRVARMIQVTFTDDGPGISEENLEKVFDPFFTTKEVGKGTGLGLSICYGLIQAHGGRIYAKSKLGEGTTFVVEIPIVSEKRPTSAGDLLAQDSRGVKWKKPKGQY